MIVTVVSECTGKSWDRSQRIIDAYLPRTGRRTWMGAITEQGLLRLKAALKETATRTSAVSCHRVVSRSRTFVAWRIGRKNAFDTIGRVPVTVSKTRTLRQDERKPAMHRLLVASVGLSSLLHDLGKASIPFVHKIENRARSGDPARHELISHALILLTLWEIGLQEDCSNKDFVEALSNVDAFTSKLDEILRGKNSSLTKQLLDILSGKIDTELLGGYAQIILGLVLTHHKLVRGTYGDNGMTYSLGSHINDPGALAKSVKFGGDLASFGSARDVSKWKDRLRKTMREISNSMSDLGWLQGRSSKTALRSLFISGRTCLIAGDKHASIQGSHHTRTSTRLDKVLYANTVDDQYVDIAEDQAAQTLARHLLSVEAASRVAAESWMRLKTKMPSLDEEAQPPDILDPPPTAGRFAWQGDAARMVRAHRQDDQAGFLAFLMASTGSGKTRAIPTLLSAVGPLRYTAALGLRTLTLQTGNEYVRKHGFTTSQVSIAIGSRLVERLDEIRRAGVDVSDKKMIADLPSSEEEAGSSTTGSNTSSEDPADVILGDDIPTLELPDIMFRWNTPSSTATASAQRRALDFIAAPILACTIDMIMPAVNGFKASFVSQAARVATADLVIDEIDDFPPRDVAVILRLIELAAANGRNVIVSSATLPKTVAIAVHAAYASGRAMFSALHGGQANFDIAWLTDAANCSRIISSDKTGDFREEHDNFVHSMTSITALIHSGRKASIDPVSVTDAKSYYEQMAGHLPRMHQVHGANDPKTGRRVSTAAVRFSNVRHAIGFSAYLSQQDLPYEVVIATYVGTLQPAMRHLLEIRLDRILNRKPVGDFDPLFADDCPLRPRIDQALKKDVIFVVVTTSMEETGRDHDFDFMILEPSSLRSLVQMAGRLRRHRPALTSDAPTNIVLMDRCLKDVLGEHKTGAYSFPGFQTRLLRSEPNAHASLPPMTATDLFAGEAVSQQVNAVGVVADPRSRIGTYEAANWKSVLLSPKDGITTGIGSAPNSSISGDICDAPRRLRLFRDPVGQTQFLLHQDERGVTYIRSEKGVPSVRSVMPIRLKDDRFLMNDIKDAVFAAEIVLKDIPDALFFSLTEYTLTLASGQEFQVFHHPLTGATTG